MDTIIGFGRNREATVEDLKHFGLDYDFTVEEIPAQDIASIAVSSTKVRNVITAGEIKKANQYLGRPFSLCGTIVKGDKIGRKIGFPTANLDIKEEYKLKPTKWGLSRSMPLGQSKIFWNDECWQTPHGLGKTNANRNIFFSILTETFTGNKLNINLLEKIRDEQKYDSLESLGNQLSIDQKSCQKLIPKYL